MREIKFRAWDKNNQRMVQCEQIWMEERIITYQGNCKIGFDNCEVMQYTGLKDGNGVEIFEGDILSDGEDEYEVCFWHGAFCLNKPTVYEELSMLIMDDYEIVGNIYTGKGEAAQ